MRNSISNQTKTEEIVNTVTHGIGIGLSIASLVILLVFASTEGDAWRVVSFSIYGASLIILYTISTLYHVTSTMHIKKFFQLLDHASIYILIAGTYTPLMLVNMRGPWGWSLFGVIWGLTIIGILVKIFHIGKNEKLSTALYVLMGWLVVIAFKEMLLKIDMGGIIWIVIGGVSYTVGTIFFILDDRFPFSHAIFHLFVLGGSITHFFGMFFYILPMKQ
jgi:hemolysin III